MKTIIRAIVYLCLFITIILAAIWFLSDASRLEPIIIILGSVSGLLLGLVSLIEYYERKSSPKLPVNMTKNELISLTAISDPISDWDITYSGSQAHAVYIQDPDLRIEHDHNSEYLHNDDFREEWATVFPDKHAFSYYYDLYYGSTRLRRIILVHVDGGRASLPMPRNQTDLEVEALDFTIASIFDNLGTLSDYFHRSGLMLIGNTARGEPA